jgi:Acyl-CoA oxidase
MKSIKLSELFSLAVHYIWLSCCVVQAHCHLMIIKEFADSSSLSSCRGAAAISDVLTDLFKLYAVHGIWTNAADFTEVFVVAFINYIYREFFVQIAMLG